MVTNLIGLSKEAAVSTLEEMEMPYRIISEDGNYYVLTMDYRPGRINLTIINGVVTSTRFG